MNISTKQEVHIINKKIKVLKIGQQTKVKNQAGNQTFLGNASCPVVPDYQTTKSIVNPNRCKN